MKRTLVLGLALAVLMLGACANDGAVIDGNSSAEQLPDEDFPVLWADEDSQNCAVGGEYREIELTDDEITDGQTEEQGEPKQRHCLIIDVADDDR